MRAGATEAGTAKYSLADGTDGLADVLIAGLEALADAGQVDAACRLAGRACALLRGADPKQWQKFNALLHRLTRRAHRGEL
jgi:hypothetical protein